jgi:hypothetical protein
MFDRRCVLLVLAAVAFAFVTPLATARAATPRPVEAYASYAAQKYCHPKPKPGTRALAAWLVKSYPKTTVPLAQRSCPGSVSEHKEGRALDWTLDATKAADRKKAAAFLKQAFATDAAGNTHALARRMGIMYIIWDDHLYGSYRKFAARDYLASSCKKKSTCSKTLRHRDHMHISLSRAGGRGDTSWYDGRLS